MQFPDYLVLFLSALHKDMISWFCHIPHSYSSCYEWAGSSTILLNIPKSGNCGDYKNKTCNFRHLNTEIYEGNHRLISTLLWVSSNSFAVASASVYNLAIKVTKENLCLKTWLIKLFKLCYASDLLLASVPPIAFICNRCISSERSSLNISLHCYSQNQQCVVAEYLLYVDQK